MMMTLLYWSSNELGIELAKLQLQALTGQMVVFGECCKTLWARKVSMDVRPQRRYGSSEMCCLSSWKTAQHNVPANESTVQWRKAWSMRQKPEAHRHDYVDKIGCIFRRVWLKCPWSVNYYHVRGEASLNSMHIYKFQYLLLVTNPTCLSWVPSDFIRFLC